MEEFNVAEGILQGLKEALAYTKGELTDYKISIREIPDDDISMKEESKMVLIENSKIW